MRAHGRARKATDLRKISADRLVVRFVEIALAQDAAILRDENVRFNRLFDQMAAVTAELRTRPGDQRRLLVALYGHGNMQVRLKAVKATLALEPEEGRRQLEDIAASGHLPQSAEAGMSLWNLDRGIFRPM